MLLSLYLCAVQATHEKLGRSLEDENGNGYNKYDEYKAEFQYNWEKTKYQVEEDLDGMWHTTPSEWGDEYWEVLIGIIGVALAITFCMMLVCCTPCCCSYADESPRYAATQEELDAKRKMKEPILDQSQLKNWFRILMLFPKRSVARYETMVVDMPTTACSGV